MKYWSVRDLRFFHHSITPSLQRRAASCRFRVWRLCLEARLRRVFFIMQKIGFAEALDSVVKSDPRYDRDAYVFLRDALDFTTKQQKKAKGTSVRHVSGPELLEGLRQYALKEFGPMVMTVFDSWGIHSSEDIGNMVFNLIGAGIFGKTEKDSIEDFRNVYDFQEVFVKPFAPEKPAMTRARAELPAPKPTASRR